MSTPFTLDSFTDTAGTALDSHVPDSGGAITKVTGNTGVAQITTAARLRAATASASINYQYPTAPSSPDYDVSCDVYLATLTADSWGAGVTARVQPGSQTFYQARMLNDPGHSPSGFSGYDIYKCVAGSYTQLALSAATTLVAGSTTRLKFSLRGSILTLWISSDGGSTFTAACTANDTSIATAGLVGIDFLGNSAPSDSVGAQIDNLNATAAMQVAPNSPAWFASPGNWIISASTAISADFGAKRSIVVAGTTTATLNFDLSALIAAGISTADYPQIRYSVDDGPAIDVMIASSVLIFSGLPASSHEIVYEFVRGNYNVDAYNTPVMALRETGLTLDPTGTASLPADLQPDSTFVTGDSITAGLLMLANSTPSGGDATATFAKALGPALSSEIGIAGKGGVGWAYAGLANVPAFTSEWKYAWNGQRRVFPTLKRLIVVMGTNDGMNSVSDSAVTTAVISWMIDARATVGAGTRIYVVIPFGGFKRSAIFAGLSSYTASHPGDKFNSIDLGLLFQIGLSGPYGPPTRQAPLDGIHPSVITHGQAGAALAAAIRAVETSSTTTTGSTGSARSAGAGVLAGL